MTKRNKQLDDKLKAFFSIDNCIEDSIGNNIIDVCEFSLDFSLEETRSILNEYGTQIKKLRYLSTIDNVEIERYAYLFLRHCKYLEYIHMIGFEVLAENIPGQLIASSKFVTYLKLNYCRVSNSAFDLISSLTDLERLDLEGSKLAGKLTTLNQLIDLSLQNCSLIGNENSLYVCRQQNLKKLNINNFWHKNAKKLFKSDSDSDSLEFYSIEKYKSSNLSRLIEVQEHLETLILSANQVNNCGIRIRNLREICFVHIDNLCNDSICVMIPVRQFIENHREILEAIEINYNVFVSEDDGYESIDRFNNLKILSYTLLGDRDLLSYFGKSCPKIEMLDIRGSKLKDICILEGIKDMAKLRYLDISYCDVQKSFYDRLVEARKSQGSQDQMIVFINPKMTLMDVMNSDFYNDNEYYVRLTTQKMRHHNSISLLANLERLNAAYPAKINKLNSLKRKSTSNSLTPCKLRILDLNLDCLREIIKYLSMAEKFILILTSRQFDQIIMDFLKKDRVEIKYIYDNFTFREAHSIFSRCGHMIRHISIEGTASHHEYMNLAQQYCKNLESIFESNSNCWYSEKLTTLSATTLNTLEIYSSPLNYDLHFPPATHQLPCLEKLFISSYYFSKYATNITSLKSLRLFDCRYLKALDLETICKSNQLMELHLSGYSFFHNNILRTLIETQKNLQILSLEYVNGGAQWKLAGLENLIDIKLFGCHPDDTIAFLKALKNSTKKQIKYLEVQMVCFSETFLSDYLDCIFEFSNLIYLISNIQRNSVGYAFVKRIIESCPRLEIFAIEHNISMSDDVFIIAVEMLLNLRHISLGRKENPKTNWNLYKRLVEIKRARNDKSQLAVYNLHQCDHLKDTRQYKAMEKYVNFSSKEISSMTKAQLTEKRIHHEIDRTDISAEGPIFNLPSNCIRKIASNLESIDKLAFAFTNKRILSTIKSIANEILYDINEISRRFTLDEAQRLFYEFRDDIYRVKYIASISSDPVEYLKLIVPYSGNFREVHLEEPQSYHRKYSVGNLFSSPDQKLEILNINFTKVDQIVSKLSDKYAQGLNPYERLKELYLGVFDEMPRLEFIKRCQLKVLDITNCPLNNNKDFIAILASQKDFLETLKINLHWMGSKSIFTIASLSSLRHIRFMISHYTTILNKLFFYLIKHRRNDLISLEIVFVGKSLHDFDILCNFFEEKQQKFVNLKHGCLFYSGNV